MTMLKPKAILWDMDGVLADTSQLHFQTWERVLAEQGIPFDKQKFHQIYGLKNQDFLARLAGHPMLPAAIENIAGQKELAFRQSLHKNIHLFPGVRHWLRRFQRWGCRQAVASSAPPENLVALVDELGIHEFFDALVEPGEQPGKPDPAVFLKAAHLLKTLPEQCIVIEDSLPGIQAARRARTRIIAVANTNPPEVLTQADIVVETLEQLTTDQVLSLFN
jgi:HAD superfamily hydrolase (TIGR01509 family)